MVKMTPPSVPGAGGTTTTRGCGPGPCFARMVALSVKLPFEVRLIANTRTGPFVPLGSRYVYAKGGLPLAVQPLLPDTEGPGGSVKTCELGCAPLATTSRVAPFAIGSPTSVFGLDVSRAATVIFRREGSPPGSGSVTTNARPRIVWSAARVP